MRLINARTKELKVFQGQQLPRYAIVSHRWEEEEVTFDDMRHGDFELRSGYYKLDGACRKAREYDCEWVWLDTCCIDKSSSTELTEAINSMFKWYRSAAVCLVYLYDYRYGSKNNSFADCEWFTRGWTLQELIAPTCVAFFDRKWQYIGLKAEMSEILADITGIDLDVLCGADPWTCSIAQRMSWAAKRKTTQVEDRAYCLLGLFQVTTPMLYGDDRAFQKLQEEIIRYSNDHTIFAWDRLFPTAKGSGLLAQSPSCFAGCGNVVQTDGFASAMHDFSMTNIGISIDLLTLPYAMNTYFAILECCYQEDPDLRIGIFLERDPSTNRFVRVEVDGRSRRSVDSKDLEGTDEKQERPLLLRRPLLVRQLQLDFRHANRALRSAYGFWIRTLKLPGYQSSERARARVYSRCGRVYQNNGMAVMMIPNGMCGTAGVVHTRPKDIKDFWQIRYLAFGFNADFTPCCMLGNGDLGRKSHKFVKRVSATKDQDTLVRKDEFSNLWLLGKPSISDRAEFKRKNYCIVDLPLNKRSKVVTIDYLGLSLSFELVPAPGELDCLQSQQSTVWAVDIRRSDGPSPQELADREIFNRGATTVQNGLAGGLKHVLISSLGAEALSVL